MKKSRFLLYILIPVFCAALMWLVFRFIPSAAVDTAEVILPTPQQSAAPSAGPDSSGSIQLVDVTPETVQSVIARLVRADSYSRTLTVDSYWSGGGSSRTVDVHVRASGARITVSGASAAKNILIDSGKLYIWYSDSPDVYLGAAAGDDVDRFQYLPTYEDILALNKSSILDAGYVDYGGENCIFAQYTDGAFGYVSRLWVSVATGLLMGCETYDGDELIYRVSSSVPEISTPDESIFSLP